MRILFDLDTEKLNEDLKNLNKEKLDKDLKIFMNYRRLKDIKRCNNFPVINREDVAQHSFYVTFLAMVLADEYNMWIQKTDLSREYKPVNIEILLRKALTHDLEESFTSDIPWNIKHANIQVYSAITEAVDKRINQVYEGCTTMNHYREINSSCKRELEGSFVKIADMLELGIYCWEEMAKGNLFFQPLLGKCLTLIHTFIESKLLLKASPLFKSLVDLLHSDVSIAKTLLDTK